MARYLTPARIVTLVLLEQYQSSDFWLYQPDTAETILQLVTEQCLQLSEPTSTDLAAATTLPRNVLEFGHSLARLDSHIPGRSWLSTLVRALWTFSTVDELHDLFERCSQLLLPQNLHETMLEDVERPPTITRASPIGQFIRRCTVEFTRLQFADSVTLWQSFVAYREPSRELWTRHYSDAKRSGLAYTPNSKLLHDSNAHHETSLVSADTVDTVLKASISQLQKLGQRVPSQVRLKLEQWLAEQQMSKSQTLHHFMAFFDSWRAGQYTFALENLHRYFDYSVAKGAGDDMKVYYQYALLHLSVLHADFEHWDESFAAMKECIATARENQDTACLNFALSWLMYLRQSRQTRDGAGLRTLAAIAGEGGNEQDEIAFLKAKARDGKHWTLMSSTLLEEAKFEMRHHGVCPKAIELVLQSSYLNMQHASMSMAPSTMMFQAAMMDRLGQAHLAHNLHSVLQQDCLAQHCSLADRTRVICRLAYDTAQRGRYSEALSMLQSLQPQVATNLKLAHRLLAFAEVLALMQAVRRSDMEAADYHMINLRPMRRTADPDVVGLADNLEFALLAKQQRLDVALVKVNNSIQRSHAQNSADVAESLALLVHKANIFAAAGRPTKGFSIALRAASSAQRHHLIPILVEALSAVARILNDLAEFEAARQLSEAALPHALEGNNMMLAARLFVTNGEAFVGLMTKTEDLPVQKQTQLAHRASAQIERAREMYAHIQDYEGQLECLLMLSQLSRWGDDEQSAERADGKYRQLLLEHQKLQQS